MPEPVIVPPAPTIVQPSTPGVDNSPGLEQVQKAFDRAYPLIKTKATESPKGTETPAAPVTPPQEPKEPAAEVKPPAPEQKPTEATKKPSEESHVPSFLEEALKLEPSQPAAAPIEEEWSDELPPAEKQSRIKSLRDAYKKLKQEYETVRAKPAMDTETQTKLTTLEAQNRQMQEILTRMGVEQSADFQQNIIAPLHGAWNEAARIVQDAGGNPQDLAKAMSLTGKAQFEALDQLFEGMPESAKSEAHDALRTYRRYEEARRQAIANAPKTMEVIRQKETQRQLSAIKQQREEMANMFDNALAQLRDESKVEVFMKSSDPNTQWWNEQGEKLVAQARQLFLENTDMSKVAMACLLAPAADAYRTLFLKSQKKVSELQKLINDRIGGEPNLTESAGKHTMMPDEQLKDDLKRPFADVFLREFHRSQSQRR